MKRIVTTDDQTGNVISTWHGGDEQDLDPAAGRTYHTLADDDTVDYNRMKWNGQKFVEVSSEKTVDVPLTPIPRKKRVRKAEPKNA